MWWYIYIYIQTHFSEQMTWKLHKFGCISDHFCVLQNTDICIYVSEQITWNLYELVACQIMFASYKIMIYIYIISALITWNLYELVACQVIFVASNIMMCIYIYNFKPNDMKFVWTGCTSDHLCMVKNPDKKKNIHIYIYIYTYLISERLVTCRFF